MRRPLFFLECPELFNGGEEGRIPEKENFNKGTEIPTIQGEKLESEAVEENICYLRVEA